MTLSINSLTEIEKDLYNTIIWDLRNQNKASIIGGRGFCPHDTLDSTGRCEVCGAYKGKIQNIEFSDYQQKILTELAISPAINHTIIITSRPIGREATLKHTHLETPKYTEFVYLSRYGNFWEYKPQKAVYLIHNSKRKERLSHSNYIVSKKWFDPRLLMLGKTLVIYPDEKWVKQSMDVDYIYDCM